MIDCVRLENNMETLTIDITIDSSSYCSMDVYFGKGYIPPQILPNKSTHPAAERILTWSFRQSRPRPGRRSLTPWSSRHRRCGTVQRRVHRWVRARLSSRAAGVQGGTPPQVRCWFFGVPWGGVPTLLRIISQTLLVCHIISIH